MGEGFWLFLPPIVLYGVILGSFATALIYRIPRDLPWAWPEKHGEGMPRSACTHCGYTLRTRDLVPLLSWLWLRGRCRECRAPIGTLYPLVELATACGCVGIYVVYGFSASSLLIMMAVPLLVALTVIDLQHYILPDVLNGMLAAIWPLVLCFRLATGVLPPQPFGEALGMALVGGAIYAGLIWLTGKIMSWLLRKDALGFGDVKFFGAAGIWLGPMVLPYFLMLSGLAGIGIGLLYRLVLGKTYFPFGPALILAFYALVISEGFELANKTPVLYLPFSFLR